MAERPSPTDFTPEPKLPHEYDLPAGMGLLGFADGLITAARVADTSTQAVFIFVAVSFTLLGLAFLKDHIVGSRRNTPQEL